MTSPNSESLSKLYEKTLNFHIKEPVTGESRESTKLTLCIEWQSASAAGHNKELSMYLTDPCDPFFMYSLCLDASDFVDLKHEQGLLVDFLAFPQSVINLLSLCLQEENKKSPKYLLYLTLTQDESASALLDVVELNQFKALTHLSLKFTSPPDIVIKQYLTTCFKNLKKENDSLKTKSGCLQQELEKQHNVSKDVQTKHDVLLQAIRNKTESELLMIKRQQDEQLKQERDKAAQVLSSECHKLREQQSEMECNYSSRCKNYESKVSRLEETLKKKQDKINTLEQSNFELESSLESSKKELLEIKRDVASSKKHYERLHSQAQDHERELEMLKVFKIDATEKLVTKDAQIAEREADFDVAVKEKKSLEANLSILSAKLNKAQDLEIVLKRDITKANQIIRKFQNEARSMNSELKSRAQTVGSLERMLMEKDNMEKALKGDIKAARAAICSREDEIDYMRSQIVSLKAKLSESQAKLQEKEEALSNKVSSLQSNSKNTVSQNNIRQQGASSAKRPVTQVINNSSPSHPNMMIQPTNVHNRNYHPQSVAALEARYLEKHPNALTIDPNTDNSDNDDEYEDNVDEHKTCRNNLPATSNNMNWKPFESVRER